MSAILLVFSERFPTSGNDINVALLIAVLVILPEQPVFVETGSGASTIVLSYFALKTGGEFYTWDTNGSKLFYLRNVLNDTLMRYFTDKNLNNHWKYVAFDSNSRFAGINILKELKKM